MAKVKPLSPKKISAFKATLIPNEVIEAFNELIAEKYSDGDVTITITEACARILKKGITQEQLDKNSSWLNVEDIYEKQGWEVNYDSPGYNESYEGFYEFTAK